MSSTPAPLARLFVYGTLRDDTLVRDITGRVFPRTAARLTGYRCEHPPGGYPRVVPDAAACVDGDVLDGIDAHAWQRFDAYEDEGRLYRRERVTVTTHDGRRHAAFVYVGIPQAFSDAGTGE